MTVSIFKHAKYVCDVESGSDLVELKYDRFVPGKGYQLFTDTFMTKPSCDWTEITSIKQNVPYEHFLNAMVIKNHEVYQQMCATVLNNILMGSPSKKQLMRTMRSMRILDNTFYPPYINFKSGWQCQFMKHMCEECLHSLIEETRDIKALNHMFNVLKLIESSKE